MTAPLYRYRVPIVRSAAPAMLPAAELLEHVTVHATDAVAAMLGARAVTGAFTALEPLRLGEVTAVQAPAVAAP